MNAELFKTLGMVAGVGGIALGVMLLVFRDIIKKNIFPKFKVEKNAYRLLRLIVISVWTVALLGIVAWAATSMITGRPADSISIYNPEYNTEMQFADYEIIVNQYQQIHGEQLSVELATELRKAINLLNGGQYRSALPALKKVSDEIDVPALYNNVGGLYALEADAEAARGEYVKAIALDPDYEATHLNLGLLEKNQGNFEQAERHLAKAESYPEARQLVRSMVETREAGLVEQEPNNDRFQPNVAPMNEVIQASISSDEDEDYFEITIPGTARDRITIELENRNLTLKPRIGHWNMDREWLGGTAGYAYQVTAGQNLSYSFAAQGGTQHLISVHSLEGSGPYAIEMVTQRAFDAYEPNEDLHSATSIPFGTSIQANLLDTDDKDNYVFQLDENVARVQIAIQNKSRSLKPRVGVYLANRQWLGGTAGYAFEVTAGQDIAYTFEAKAGDRYFVSVTCLEGAGEYLMTVKGA